MPVRLEFVPRLLTADQAAYYLGISKTKLLSLELPRKVLGAKRLYERHDLDDFAEQLDYDRVFGNTVAALFENQDDFEPVKKRKPKRWAKD